MKRFIILMIAVFSICAVLFAVSCKKDKSTSSGCPIGGFASSSTIMFWVSKDYAGGAYTVQVIDDQGSKVTLNYNQVSVYNSAEPNACNISDANYYKHALVAIQYGHTYTYTATSTNRSFKGTIVVPCDETYNCISVQIDKQ